jgi:hypothetical protein
LSLSALTALSLPPFASTNVLQNVGWQFMGHMVRTIFVLPAVVNAPQASGKAILPEMDWVTIGPEDHGLRSGTVILPMDHARAWTRIAEEADITDPLTGGATRSRPWSRCAGQRTSAREPAATQRCLGRRCEGRRRGPSVMGLKISF